MAALAWPDVLRYAQGEPQLVSSWLSGGPNMRGVEQRAQRDAGYWELSISGLALRRADSVRAWRALHAQLRTGRSVAIPICDVYCAPGAQAWPTTALAAPAALRATRLSIVAGGAILTPGVYLGIGGRLHLVTAVAAQPERVSRNNLGSGLVWTDATPWEDAPLGAPSPWLVDVLPPLRAAADAGAEVRLHRPTLPCRLKAADSGTWELQLKRFGAVSVEFSESQD